MEEPEPPPETRLQSRSVAQRKRDHRPCGLRHADELRGDDRDRPFYFARRRDIGSVAIVAIPVGICYVAGAISLGRKLYQNPVYRGWGMGIWIGLGLAVLVQGGCFLVVISR